MTPAVRTESAYASVAGLLRDAKARIGPVSYASTGSVTVSRLKDELLAQSVGVTLFHVPYPGAAPAITDMLGSQVALLVTSAASIDLTVEASKVPA